VIYRAQKSEWTESGRS